jgi:hypothetical protein
MDNIKFVKFVHSLLTFVGVQFPSPDSGFGRDKTQMWVGLVISTAADLGGGGDMIFINWYLRSSLFWDVEVKSLDDWYPTFRERFMVSKRRLSVN